ncbi:Cobalt-precorrin-6x reductase [[Actinomadura] parvosata subsp. kistnae]|uniref:Cobalt-precorrin-6A reductase n=1 Tax=[Actinomadura] parvosata subsp. kistnae TaxID=1909395 RepID=A0A1U9ZTN8_9ACTN|nr:cobalt-precorrin-6A reductase [Nonomuraea sp. ATCC 55076]AQZ61308.1 cobalt-precorrin-6A reductase [Nonomuraea sp. ATCC 55076]SPL97962.1 Cobalt-precorrin-6x reductase [Actinomadura parvosata subsp. kistnae]
MRRVLILGGTAEARALAAELTALPGLHVVSSLAGRVNNPRLPVGEVREGGFGGPDGLAAYLTDEHIDALVDATHPFAQRMTASAAAASAATGVPLLVLRRPGWQESAGDTWQRVDSLQAAAALLRPGARVFLTTGRRSLPLFTGLLGVWLLARSVDPPEPPVPPNVHVLLDRGPYTVEGERALIREHALTVLVTKDSGGTLTAAKLTAARELDLPVIMVNRPPLPPGVHLVDTVAEAATWAATQT